jgi:hypothetical protein
MLDTITMGKNRLMLDVRDQEAKSIKKRSREAHLRSTASEKLTIKKHTRVDASEQRLQGTRYFVNLSGDQRS